MSQEQALHVAFSSGIAIERRNVYLTELQVQEITQQAKSKMDSNLVTFYVGKSSSGIDGIVFFNSHMVRTMPETMMVVVAPNGTVRSVEILSFYEPEDYRPSQRWLKLFSDKKLDNDLWVKRGIRNVTGATLTTQAITEAVRRILAIYEVGVKPVLKESK